MGKINFERIEWLLNEKLKTLVSIFTLGKMDGKQVDLE
jgi:hypothetical protein